jgi:hypothetical protein
MAKQYCIWVVSPHGYSHSRAFDEIALGLQCAFSEMGYDVPIVRAPGEITDHPIVLGCNLIPHVGTIRIPKKAVMYNLEQIQPTSPWMTPDYVNLLRSYEVWDYSRKNIEELGKLGVTNVRFCGIGYVPELTRIPASDPDIDILLYGSLNERRYAVLEELNALGFKVKALFDLYGETRDRYIARSRIVLNVHYYEARVFEIVRISYLLANRRFVVSESGNDLELERPFRGGLVFARYEDLAYSCSRYLREDDLRDEIAGCGLSGIRSLPQASFLRDVLGGEGDVS